MGGELGKNVGSSVDGRNVGLALGIHEFPLSQQSCAMSENDREFSQLGLSI